MHNFAGRRILITGDVMLDEYIWGEVKRVSPEAPVPVVEVHHRTYNVGGAANVATNVTALGGQAIVAGVIGSDEQGRILQNMLARGGADTSGLLVDPSRPTTTKTRILAQNHQIARLDIEDRSALVAETERRLLRWLDKQVHWADACVLSDYSKGVVTPRIARYIAAAARTAGKPLVVDPKCRDFRRYRGATVVTPNVFEARLAVGVDDDEGGEAELHRVAVRLQRRLKGTALLITRGAEGMSLFRDGQPSTHIAACARSVFDVTGAGDTVVGTLALALAAGLPLETAARFANQAAGIAVAKLGAATVSPEELFGTETPRTNRRRNRASQVTSYSRASQS